MLEAAGAELATEYPGVVVHGVVGDFQQHVGLLPTGGRRLIVFLGGTIGNLLRAERHRLLAALRTGAGPDDALLLGTDLVKDPRRLVAAYDDAAGVTAAFNRNVLTVINRELDGNLDAEAFHHVAIWDPDEEWIEMRLQSSLRAAGPARRARISKSRSSAASSCVPRSAPSSGAKAWKPNSPAPAGGWCAGGRTRRETSQCRCPGRHPPGRHPPRRRHRPARPHLRRADLAVPADPGQAWVDARVPARVRHFDAAACGRPSRTVLATQTGHLEAEAEFGGYVAEEQAEALVSAGRAALARMIDPDGLGRRRHRPVRLCDVGVRRAAGRLAPSPRGPGRRRHLRVRPQRRAAHSAGDPGRAAPRPAAGGRDGTARP